MDSNGSISIQDMKKQRKDSKHSNSLIRAKKDLSEVKQRFSCERDLSESRMNQYCHTTLQYQESNLSSIEMTSQRHKDNVRN